VDIRLFIEFETRVDAAKLESLLKVSRRTWSPPAAGSKFQPALRSSFKLWMRNPFILRRCVTCCAAELLGDLVHSLPAEIPEFNAMQKDFQARGFTM